MCFFLIELIGRYLYCDVHDMDVLFTSVIWTISWWLHHKYWYIAQTEPALKDYSTFMMSKYLRMVVSLLVFSVWYLQGLPEDGLPQLLNLECLLCAGRMYKNIMYNFSQGCACDVGNVFEGGTN